MRLHICLSIDLDEIYCYYQIYGLEYRDIKLTYPVYTIALDRIHDFFDTLGIKNITLFVVGQDLENESNIRKIKALNDAGYEIANHTYSHPYNLINLKKEKIEEEIETASILIHKITGKKPCGFRAPGYNITPAIFDILTKKNFLYDSSIFPSPPYYILKAAVIFLKRLKGKKSSSILGPPSQLFYRANRPFRINKNLIEFPVSVVPFLRIPFIGTFFSLMGKKISDIMTDLTLCCSSHLCIEFHGIDFLDYNDLKSYPEILKEQKDVNIPWNKKRDIFKQVIYKLGEKTSSFKTIHNMAQEFTSNNL